MSRSLSDGDLRKLSAVLAELNESMPTVPDYTPLEMAIEPTMRAPTVEEVSAQIAGSAGWDYAQTIAWVEWVIGRRGRPNPRARRNPGPGLGALMCIVGGNPPRAVRFDSRRGWVGLDGRTLYAFTDKRTSSVVVRPGNQTGGIGPEVDVRVATRAEAEKHWQSPLHAGWKTNSRRRNPGRARTDLGDDRDPVKLRLPRKMIKGQITLGEALRRNIPGIREALKGFPRFHELDLSQKVWVIDDGRRDNIAGFLIGRTPEVTYDDVPPGSNKEGNPWVHKTSKTHPSYLVHIPKTGVTEIIGHMKVSDWLREKHENRRH